MRKVIGGAVLAMGLLLVMAATGGSDAGTIGIGTAVVEVIVGGAMMAVGGKMYA